MNDCIAYLTHRDLCVVDLMILYVVCYAAVSSCVRCMTSVRWRLTADDQSLPRLPGPTSQRHVLIDKVCVRLAS